MKRIVWAVPQMMHVVKSSSVLSITYFDILISSSSLYLRDSWSRKAFASSTVVNSTNTDPLNERSTSFLIMMVVTCEC